MIPISSFLGFSIYEAISIPLYLRIIYVLFTGKEFKYPFFRFLCVIGVLEICHYAIDVVFYRLPMFGPTVDLFDKSPSRILSVVPFLIYFLNYPIYVLHIAITLNRFSGIWVPVKQAKFWQRYWVPIIIAAFLISFCFTFHRIFTTSQMLPFVPSDPNKGYIPLIIKYDLYVIDTNLLTAVFNSFVFLFSLTVNGMTIYKVVQLNKSGMMNSAAQKAELNLLIIAIWMTVTLAVLIAFQLSLFMIRSGLLNNVLDVGETNYTLFLLQPLVEILGTESHPWVLITMSSAIRNAALPFWAGLSKKVFKDKQSTTKVIPSSVERAQTNKIGAGTVTNLNIRQVKVSG